MENEDTNIWICPWCRQEIKMESGNFDHLAAHLAHEIFWHIHLEDGVPIRDIVAEIWNLYEGLVKFPQVLSLTGSPLR